MEKPDKLAESYLQRLQSLRKAYRPMHDEWLQDLRYYKGRPLSYKSKRPHTNLVLAYVETHTAYMLSAVPEVFVRSFNPAFEEAAQFANDLMGVWQVRVGLQEMLQDVFRQVSQIGTAFLRVGWRQPTGSDALGEPVVELVDPFRVFVDRRARRIDQAEYIFTESYVMLEDALRTYPAMKARRAELQSVNTEEADWYRERQEIIGQPLFLDEQVEAEGLEDAGKQVQLVEVWSDGGRVLTKILGGKLLTEVIEGEEITYPIENPYEHGTFPYVPFYATTNPWGFWGLGDIRNIRDSQDQVNVRRQQETSLLDTGASLATKMFVNARDMGVKKTDDLDNTDYMIIGLDDLANVPQLSASLAVLGGLLQSVLSVERDFSFAMDQITGIYDAAKGGSATGVYSGRHASMLQGASSVRFQPRLDATMTSMKRLGRLMLALMQQFQTMGINQREFSVRRGHQNVKVRTHDDKGEPILPRLNETSKPGFDPNFEIVVQPTDEQPMARQQQVQQVMSMAQSGMADARALVRISRMPHGEETLDRLARKAAAGLAPGIDYPDDFVEHREKIAHLAADVQELQLQLQKAQLQQQLAAAEGAQPAVAPITPESQGGAMPPGAMAEMPQFPPEALMGGAGPVAEMAQDEAEMMYQNVGAQ